ncbi:glutathione S-transferase family protein [bacterium]|nr:glutathione S-transferase family protein [bacterium]
MDLYYYPYCPFSRRVQIVLEKKGIKHNAVKVDIDLEEHKKESFLAMNPFGQLPVLVDGGRTLFEASVICAYLDYLQPDPPIHSEDGLLRAHGLLLEKVHDRFISPEIQILWSEYFHKKPASRNEAAVSRAFKSVQKSLAWVNKQIEGTTYMAGENFGLADAAYVHTVLNMMPQLNIDLSAHKNISAWAARAEKVKSVIKTNPGFYKIAEAQAKKTKKVSA